MHPVGHMGDGHIFHPAIRPQEVPHLSGHFTMQFRNCVAIIGQMHGQDGHREGISTPGLRVTGNINELIAVRPSSFQINGKYLSINQSGNSSLPAGTGVWVVNTLDLRTISDASSKVDPACHELPNPFQGQEGRMTFVHVPGCWVDIQGS